MPKTKKEFQTNADVVDAAAKDFGGGEDALTRALPNPEQVAQVVKLLHVPINVKRLPHYTGLPGLKRATLGSSGVDLFAANDEPICLNTIGSMAIVPTGIAIELPVGFEAQIRPRSGLAAKEGITVLNTPGTIDSDYRGEIKIILAKVTTNKFFIERGMRIAQMVVQPVVIPELHYVEELGQTDRGEGGFGSTGK